MRYILMVKIGYSEWRLVFENVQELATFVETGIKHTDDSGDKVSYSIDIELEDREEDE